MTEARKKIADKFLETKNIRIRDHQRTNLLNANLVDVITQDARKMFSKQTADEIIERMTPINVFRKIVTKQAKTYLEEPTRSNTKKDEGDSEQVQHIVEMINLNDLMDMVEERLVSHKRVMVGLGFDGEKFEPEILEPEYYYVDGFPANPNFVVKATLLDLSDLTQLELVVIYKDRIEVIDGHGAVKSTTENNLGFIPYFEIGASIATVQPEDRDTLTMSKIIPIIASDVSYVIKYQAWSVIHTVGMKEADIKWMPNTIISSDFGGEDGTQVPKIDIIKPQLEIVQTTDWIKFLIANLLSQNNLSTSAISTQLGQGQNYASGIARIIDSAEIIEEQKSRRNVLRAAERKILQICQSWYEAVGKIGNFSGFTPDFKLQLAFAQPSPVMSESDKLKLSQQRIDAGFSTLRRELAVIYPEMDEKEIEKLIEEIEEDRANRLVDLVTPNA